MFNWVQAEGVTVSGLEENKMTEIAAGEKRVGLIKREGKVYAFAATCPHASARLCDGGLDALGRIICPLHKYKFDPVNGRNTSGEGYKLKTYPVEIKEDNIYIGLI
jgi:nitrite reductase/ring-hydroxylating ferredoxin subunit